MPVHRSGESPQQIKRDPLKNGFYTGTRVLDTFDCTWVCTYDLWYNCINKAVAKRDEGTEYIATFENLDDWMNNYQEKKKPVFAVLMEPYNRWLEGLRYWLMEWQIAEKDRKLWDISRDSPLFFEKFNWPRMGNHTKTITECLSGIKIDGYLVADMNMDKKFIDFVKHYNLRFPWDFKITDYHQLIYDPVGMDQYRKEMNQYAQWLNEHHKFRDKVIQDYLKEDYNLWYKHKRF
jgi:hypothetical protein